MTDLLISNMQLGRYQIQGRIGAGGMARVFKAYDANLERLVAIKILHDHLADDPNFKERFEREAKLVATFNHPNVVQVYDFASLQVGEQNIYYMVMPYIPGKTLRDVLDELNERGERMAHERVIEIMRGLCDALGYAHESGMVHRDVKPANILFNERQQAVLTDFGIARLIAGSKLTQEGVTTGTPAYMSPEQVAGLPVDARSDIYSLGVILFEMLSGQLPFNDENSISIMLKHINAPIPRLSEVMGVENPAFDTLMLKALAKDPKDRYATTRDLTQDFITALTGVDAGPLVQISQPGPKNTHGMTTQVMDSTDVMPEAQPRAPHRSPLGILAIGMTLIALVAVIALFSRPPQTASSGAETPSESGVGSMTAGDSYYFTSQFDADSETNRYWPQDNSGGLRRQITDDGYYRLVNPTPGTAATSIFEPMYEYQDVTISLEGLLETESQRSSAYGIVFRYQDADNYNVFAVDGAGRYSIWVRSGGVWHELRGQEDTWSESDAILTLGQPNVLRLDIRGSALIGYVNDQMVVEALDDTFRTGSIGVYVATPPAGTASVLINLYQVDEASRSVPSMTTR